MPGVLIDDQNFHLDTMPQSSFYETLGSYPTSPLNQSHQMMRHSSFKESSTNGLSHSAPVYNRSQSAISPAAVMNAFNYFSPPNTPKKGNEGGFSGLSMADVEEYNNLADEERMAGLGSPSSVGLGAQASSAIAMAMAGNNASTDLRSLAFGNSALVGSPTLPDSVTALHKFLPSNDEDECWGNSVVDVYACDQFRMFEFKVRRCMRGRSHDWTECPFAHPGEKARRRDPRRFHYSGTACPDFRKGSCRRGDACEFAHGVFECWLHPARYRTQPCKDGRNCRRRVCFFAHTPEQLRLLPAAAHANAAARNGGMSGSQGSILSGAGSLSGSYDGSPGRGGASYDGAYSFDGTAGCVSHCSPTSHGSCQNGAVPNGACSHFEHTYGGNVSNLCCASQMSSPTSTLVGHSPSPPPLSPPLSPSGSPPMSPQSPHWSSSPSLHQQSINSSITSFMNQTLSAQAGGYPVHSGYSQGPCSPLSRPSNSNSVMSAIQVPGPHMNNITSAAQRRHLDRLNSMPALSIPPVDHSHRGMLQSVTSPLSSPSSCSPPSPGAGNHHNSVSDLIATIQQLGLRSNGGVPLWVAAQSMQAANQAQSIQSANQYSSGPSPLRRCSQSVPSTPTKPRWEGDSNRFAMDSTTEEVEPPVLRVESGRDLRAKIYGRLGKENRTDNGDTPDLGWVNELVKDEQLW